MAAALRNFLLAVALSAAALHGQEDSPEEHIDVVDVDQDMLTPEHVQDMLTPKQLLKVHGLADANEDGKLSVQELSDFSQKTRIISAGKDVTTVLEGMDLDNDGKLSFDELQSSVLGGSQGMEGEEKQEEEKQEEEKQEEEKRMALEKMKFEAADLDRDGLLTKEEVVELLYPEQKNEVLKVIAQDDLSAKDTDKDGHLTPSEFWDRNTAAGEAGQIADEELKEFKLHDRDGDGRLSLEELMHWESGNQHTKAVMDQLMATADKNSDGHITAEELSGALHELAGTDAHYHFLEWVEHHEL
eukprot:TRINITY_DN1805_c0_g4_i1.p1 TRINITY_DN1805_c0_g4~~TRINITY_DN1805_c0_g4_i1.p1  ORF type:complete len:323 (-),score=100.41 TRINITY_DN1805_c0_g4_i1:370-1269(-)